MKDLLEYIATALVEHPDRVRVTEVEEEGDIVFELEVDPEDLGRVIGREGRTVRAFRTLLGVAGTMRGLRYDLEILE